MVGKGAMRGVEGGGGAPGRGCLQLDDLHVANLTLAPTLIQH